MALHLTPTATLIVLLPLLAWRLHAHSKRCWSPRRKAVLHAPHLLGLALLALFMARIAYRGIEIVWLLPPKLAG